MNIKFIKTDPRDTIEVTKLEYIDELENDRAYYLSLCGGELEWEVGRIVTFDEAFEGKSIHKTGEVYIWIVQHIFKIINIPYFDLVHLLKIHDLLNENDLKLLLIHTNNAVNRSNKNEMIENKEKAKELKERINELLLLNKNEPQQKTKTDAPTPTKNENLYNEYFRGNTFLLFKAYCDEYNIDNTCRTDLRVLFQLFTKHEYFVDTMELKHYLKFLNKYLKYDSVELRKTNLNTKPNIVRTNNFNRIKNNLKLTLE